MRKDIGLWIVIMKGAGIESESLFFRPVKE